MNEFSVEYPPEVHEDVKQLSRNIQPRIKTVIEERLMTHPHKYGQRLRQSLHNLWRIRTGDYRIGYEIYRDEKKVVVWGILHRKEIYAEIRKRRNR